jgi:hypothetical protein
MGPIVGWLIGTVLWTELFAWAWLYFALIVALTLGMYLLFRNHSSAKPRQPQRQHAVTH